ncbi:MAG: isopropylmalate isomerase [Bacteroides sp. SM23_62]|nr:MAG: isopropylmalate isomerase [Bacteroides sp. SM23_62]
MSKTLFDKIWERHVVDTISNGPDVLYIDRHFIHEVTSPQAFTGLKKRGIKVFRPERVFATPDHNVPTIDQHMPIQEKLSRLQVERLTENCREHGIQLFHLNHEHHGIVHIIGPELGITQPGQTIVCGDSHTATHGAFGTIAFGIGTSEVEMVLASQCLLQYKPKKMKINVEGELGKGVVSKDVILYIIARLGAGGGTGYFVEYAGSTFRNMSMEARMTVCNMSIEMGARGGLIAPDEKTFEYLKGRKYGPQDTGYDEAVKRWKELYTDPDAVFDAVLEIKAEDIPPMLTYGTNPGMGIPVDQPVPGRAGEEKALDYMGLKQGELLLDMPVNYVFIGSCTNARIEDFRAVADIVRGKQKADNIRAYLIPGSKLVEKQIDDEGLREVLEDAGFEIRQPGCSACLGMNEDKVPRGEYCVSTSNRNFEGRQGPESRTILASPLTAAATALSGKITDVRHLV